MRLAAAPFAAGVLPDLGMGAPHACCTARDQRSPSRSAPRDLASAAAMRAITLHLDRATTKWRASTRFEPRHGLGATRRSP